MCAARMPGVSGLSPRVRGNRPSITPDGVHERSIPACAGEPHCPISATGARQVYPRVCGGTAGSITPPPLTTGLSPRVRGNLAGYIRCVCALGSIPACAGEPGEHKIVQRPREGLSPRVRGNPAGRGIPLRAARSIPACAGEPALPTLSRSDSRVYPRVCGGTDPGNVRVDSPDGLSPRVRGNHGQRTIAGVQPGSIPACAGEPPAAPAWRKSRRVYPRVCGGTR